MLLKFFKLFNLNPNTGWKGAVFYAIAPLFKTFSSDFSYKFRVLGNIHPTIRIFANT